VQRDERGVEQVLQRRATKELLFGQGQPERSNCGAREVCHA
jgi:hypothetical protein